MTRYAWLNLIVPLLVPALAPAQGPPDMVRQGYEEIEIMRGLLLDKIQTNINQCSKCHVNPFINSDNPGKPGKDVTFLPDGRLAGPSVGGDGAYVKGHGVIYQVHMPLVMSIRSLNEPP